METRPCITRRPGAAIDAVSNIEYSALHVAAGKGLRDVCTLLLDAGASLHVVDDDGDTPLHYAAYLEPEITDLLLSRGAAIDAINISRNALHVAARFGQRKLCTFLSDAGAPLYVVDKYGCTPLHCVALSNQPEITELLLSRGAAIDAVNNIKRSTLHVAAKHRQRKLCTLLLANGASLCVVDKYRNTPLHCAAYALREERAMRYHCDVNVQDFYGDIALHEAIRKNALDVIDALLCACERVDFTLRNKQDFNILHHAAFKGNAHIMERLITCARHSLVDMKMENGTTALHLATLRGHRQVAAILLSQNGGRAKVDLRNNRGQTPLCLATLQKHWPLVELMVHHNADVSSIDLDGNNVLHIAT
ncbi:PREDICTED: E3 ubiquitin-protein ligase MIB2-like [Wasmannia auropunctata]|uniref:E3 ubiquitin-protein ligase MIB2-like n=1 Tax=Wasmannia auropunctata TaxID=64793 RepID=UPI0005EF2643|nr:PREDICTED: E3 ubiquitin-protein ligase MIB2-like [Wasmannia auropunctata]